MTHGTEFLPINREEMRKRGWSQLDVVIITADAYVDHPSFGAALIGRLLEREGRRVGILAQPDWRSAEAFRSLGRPRLFFGITSGAVDSRLNRHTSLGGLRHRDLYSPGGKTGMRPDRPLLVYAARAREAFRNVPIVLGGLEASLRRLVHYDYVEDRLKRSVLIDSKADLLVYGMGERQVIEIARRLDAGEDVRDLTDIPGTAYRLKKGMPPLGGSCTSDLHNLGVDPEDTQNEKYKSSRPPSGGLLLFAYSCLQGQHQRHVRRKYKSSRRLPGLEEQRADSTLVMEAHLTYARQARPGGMPVTQENNPGTLVVMPPSAPLSREELDAVYAMPFTRKAHPVYDRLGGVPALEPVQFSLVTHRGCFGGCSFCSIYFHQGRQICSRSRASIIGEAESFLSHPDFRGTIPDLGAPTANMYGMSCTQAKTCDRPSCLWPEPCKHLKADHAPLMSLMEDMLRLKNVKTFVASGIRHDLALKDKDYMRLLISRFTGGHLKVAPEHKSARALRHMRKPAFERFLEFEACFESESRRAGKEQYLVPYFISSHPGCTEDDALELTEFLLKRGRRVRQAQDFTPIPLTYSTAMYVAEQDGAHRRIFVPKGRRAKALQMRLLKYHEKKSRQTVSNFLQKKGKNNLLEKFRRLKGLD